MPGISRATILIGAILWMSTVNNFLTTAEWTYDGADKALEPARWGEEYQKCNGIRNSPINIETEKVVSVPLSNVWITSSWDNNSVWDISYLQYSVSLKLTTGSPRIGLSGGHLPGNYSMVEMHFHWGRNDSRGSEHTINGHSFPMELHCVHLNSKYKTVTEGLSSNDTEALAVLGFMFKIQEQDNPALDRLINGLNETLHINKTNTLYNLGKLTEFLSESAKGGFWRYEGSLTTPPCNQQVVWTVFSTDIKVSAAQMQVLRSFKSDHYGTELYRPTQPLHNRTVWYHEPSITQTEATGTKMELSSQQVTEPSSTQTKAEASTIIKLEATKQQVTEPFSKEKGTGNFTKQDTMTTEKFTIPILIVKEPMRPHRTDLENTKAAIENIGNKNLTVSIKLLATLLSLLAYVFNLM